MGVGMGATLAKDLNASGAAFKAAMLSSGQFTATTVKMTSEVAKFGTALETGKLKLSDYYNIMMKKSGEATASLKLLAAEQVKLQNSIIMSDPTKRGILSVFTPTQINAVANATKLATMEQNLYNLAIAKGSTALITWGKNTQWAGRQLSVGLTMPMVMFGAVAAKTFKDVNTELTRLQRLYGVGLVAPSQQQIDKISTSVIDLGKQIASTMGIAQKDVAATAADFAAIGRTGDDLLTATTEAMRLSKLGGVDAHTAFLTITSLQNTFKVSSGDLNEAVNFFSAIQKQTALNIQDVSDALPRIGPIVRQLGGNYRDTALMMLSMKEAGVPAAQAANAIKSAMASMISPTRAAKDAFAGFNINLASLSTKSQGNPVVMIQALQQALSQVEPLARAQLIEKLFGKFQFARVTALLDNLGKAGSQTQLGFKIAGASIKELSDLTAQEMKLATESTTGKFSRAVESFKATIYPIGQKFLEIMTIILKFGNAVGKAFSGLPGPVKSILGIFAGGAALAGPIIMLTGLLANFAGYIMKGMLNLKLLATGGTSFKQLLTPELVAASTAAQVFDSKILQDVEAVDLLSAAIQRLTVSMESMAMAMSMSAGGIGGMARVAQVATMAKAEQMVIPGFANSVVALDPNAGGGYVTGPGPKGVDSIHAMIAPGESVVSAAMTEKHAPIIDAVINDAVPGYAESYSPGGLPQYRPSGGHSYVMQETIRKNAEFAARQAAEAAEAQVASRYKNLPTDPVMRSRLTDVRKFAETSAVPRQLRAQGSSMMWGSKAAEETALRSYMMSAGITGTAATNMSGVQVAHMGNPYVNATTPVLGNSFMTKGTQMNKLMPEFGAVNSYGNELTKGATKAGGVVNKFIADTEALAAAEKKLGLAEGELLPIIEEMKPNITAENEMHAKILKTLADYDINMKISSEKVLQSAGGTSAVLGARLGSTNGMYSAPMPMYSGNAATIEGAASRSIAREGVMRDMNMMYKDPGLQTLQNKVRLEAASLNAGMLINPESQLALTAQERKLAEQMGLAASEGLKLATPQVVASAERMMTETLIGAKASAGIASPAEVWAAQVGAPLAQGVAEGVQLELPLIKTSVGSAIHESLLEAVAIAKAEAPAAGKAIDTAIAENIVANAPIVSEAGAVVGRSAVPIGPLGANGGFTSSEINKVGMMSRFRNPGMGMRMGTGMGMMGGAMALSMAAPNNEAAKAASSALMMGSMIAMFNPLAGAAVAATMLVVKGIGAIIAAEKEHKAITQSAYQVTSEALAKYKDQIDKTTISVTGLAAAEDARRNGKQPSTADKNAATETGFTVKEIEDKKAQLEKAVKDDPKSTAARQYNLLKGMNDSSGKSQAKEATKMAAALVAIGVSKQDANREALLMLAATGQSTAGYGKVGGTAAKQTTTNVNALTQSSAIASTGNGSIDTKKLESLQKQIDANEKIIAQAKAQDAANKKFYDDAIAKAKKEGRTDQVSELENQRVMNGLQSNTTPVLTAKQNIKILQSQQGKTASAGIGAGTDSGISKNIDTILTLSTKGDKVKAIITGLNGTFLKNKDAMNAVIEAYKTGSAEQQNAVPILQQINKLHLQGTTALTVLRASQVLMNDSSAAAKKVLDAQKASGQDLVTFLADPKNKKVLDEWASHTISAKDLAAAGVVVPTLNDPIVDNGGPTKLDKAYDKIIKQENLYIKKIRERIDAQKTSNDEAKRSQDFAIGMTDLQNQIKQATATGDFLKANLLRQQMLANKDQYDQQTIDIGNQKILDKAQTYVTDLEQMKVDKTPLPKAKYITDSGIKSYQVGNVSLPSAAAVGSAAQFGTMTNSNNNVVVNINGSNLNQAQLSAAVMDAIAKAGLKNGTVSAVGRP